MKAIVAVLLLSLSLSISHAQKPEKGAYKRLSVDLYAGVPLFFGDVKNQFKSFTVSARVNYGLTSALSISAELSYGLINGLDKNANADFFSTNYLKAMGGGEVYLLNILKFSELGSKFQPYAGLHFGAVQANVTSAGSNSIEDVNKFKGWTLAHQWHLGAKFKLSKTFDLNFRGALLAMKSDKIDNEFATVAANKTSDAIFSMELGVTIHLGGRGKDPIVWYDPHSVLEESIAIDTVLPLEFSLDEKLNLINTKRIQNEAKTALEIAALKMEKDDLKSQVDALERKVNELIKLEPPKAFVLDKPSGPPTEETVYQAVLIGPIDAEYYIVSGSFSQLINAEQRVTQLNKKEYTPVIMREPSSNNLNRVVIDTANSFKKALQLVIKYKKELDPNTWIIKQKK
jgi:hypothetical protein